MATKLALDVMRTKSRSMPMQLLRKDLCKLICIEENYVQDKLAIVRTGWKLHVKIQNENEATFFRPSHAFHSHKS